MKRYPALCLLLALTIWSGYASPSHAGVLWTYRGLEWMISAASDIVVATEVPQAPQQISALTGKPIIRGLPDIANGIQWKVVIQHVLKGKLQAGEHVDVYLPITEYIGNHPVEFPVNSANFMIPLRGNSVIMFLHRTGNTISLETLPCFGSAILADPDNVANFSYTGELRENILGLIEQDPQLDYPSWGSGFDVTKPGATIYETGSASLYDALKDPHDIAVVTPYIPNPANWKSGRVNYDFDKNEFTGPRAHQFKITGRIRCDMNVGTTFTATLHSLSPTTPSENYLVFLAPLTDLKQPYRQMNFFVKLAKQPQSLSRQNSETVDEAVHRLLEGLDPRFY